MTSRSAALPSSTPAVVILGADAVLAALPATPVQLAHACQRLGFAAAFPASWGDELVADACLRALADHRDEPAILCTCPRVRDRLLRAGPDLAPWMISLVAPPVAVARYLRAAYGARSIHVTYVGGCPGARDPAIDVQLLPAELFQLMRDHHVSAAAQPQLFESVIPPDRRRSLSMPGGPPTDDALQRAARGRVIAELSADDPLAALADRLIAGDPVLLDLAPHIGCPCSAVGEAVGGGDERLELMALEPPRISGPVLDPAVEVDLALPVHWEGPRPPSQAGRIAPRSSAPAKPVALPASPRPTPPAVSPRRGSLSIGEPLPVVARFIITPPSTHAAVLEEPPEHSHAVIREFPHGVQARHVVSITRRRGAAETPLAAFAGSVVPRAYLGKRPRRRPARRAKDLRTLALRGSHVDLERRIERWSELAERRRTPRGARAGILPFPPEPMRPVPPPPARRKTETVLGIGAAFIGIALSLASLAGVPS